MAKGKQTPPETIYKVMASFAVTNNLSETARAFQMPVATIKKIVDDNKDKPEFERLCNETKQEFVESADRIIKKALNRLETDLDDVEKVIPINHLTTAIGTLYDKRALAKGESTQNENIEVNIKIV